MKAVDNINQWPSDQGRSRAETVEALLLLSCGVDCRRRFTVAPGTIMARCAIGYAWIEAHVSSVFTPDTYTRARRVWAVGYFVLENACGYWVYATRVVGTAGLLRSHNGLGWWWMRSLSTACFALSTTMLQRGECEW